MGSIQKINYAEELYMCRPNTAACTKDAHRGTKRDDRTLDGEKEKDQVGN